MQVLGSVAPLQAANHKRLAVNAMPIAESDVSKLSTSAAGKDASIGLASTLSEHHEPTLGAVTATAVAVTAAVASHTSRLSRATSSSTTTADISPCTLHGDQLATIACQAPGTACQLPLVAAAGRQGDGDVTSELPKGSAAAAHNELGTAAAELALLAADLSAAEAAQCKVEPIQSAQHESTGAAPKGLAAALLPEAEFIESLAAQINALSKQIDSHKAAMYVPSVARRTVSRGTSSDTPVLLSLQQQEQHQSMRSLAFVNGSGVSVAAAAAAVEHKGTTAGSNKLSSSRSKPLQEATVTAFGGSRLGPGGRPVVLPDAATLSSAWTRHESKYLGKQGYVPQWLREWRPKARVAAAAAAASIARQQRSKAAAASAAAAAAAPQQPQQLQQQLKRKKHGAAEVADLYQQHKHLALSLGGLGDCAGDTFTQDKPIKAVAAASDAAHCTYGSMAQRAAAAAAQQAPSQAGPSFVSQQMFQAAQLDSVPAAPAALDAAVGTAVGSMAHSVAATAGVGKPPPSFVFTAEVMRPLQQFGASKDNSGPASEANSPEAMVGVEDPFHRLRSSAEPDYAAAAADASQGQRRSRVSNRSREGSALFSLPKREWKKLSATAGLTKKQRRAAQAKAVPSNVHMARAVQFYRGVFAVEGTALYEVRMYRNKLGKVLRLKNHYDPIAAARAFDRAALCLSRAAAPGGKQCADLNFPEEEYAEEELPDLTGKSPSEMLAILVETFSGSAVAPPERNNLHTWPSTGQVSIVWGRKDLRTPLSLTKTGRKELQLEAGPKGYAALEAAGIEKWDPEKDVQEQQERSMHPAAQAAAAAGFPGARWYQHGMHQGMDYQQQLVDDAAAAAAWPSADAAAAAAMPRVGAPLDVLRELQQSRMQEQRQAASQRPLPVAAPSMAPAPQQPLSCAVPSMPAIVQQHQASAAVPRMAAVAQQSQPSMAGAVRQAQQQQQQQHQASAAVPSMTAAAQQAQQQQQQQPPCGEGAVLAKMLGDLQQMSTHCEAVKQGLVQFAHELTSNPAAREAAAVSQPPVREEVCNTLLRVDSCLKQQAALQQLLGETMRLLQPALSDEERRKLQCNSVQLVPALEALATTLSSVCRAVLRAAVAQDAAACSVAATTTGFGDNNNAGATAGGLPAGGCSRLTAMQHQIAPQLDSIPAGSARAQRMTRLSRAIRASQESMMAAKRVLAGQD